MERLPALALGEQDRETAAVVIYDGYQARNYRFAPFNPDALIASKGYDEIDKLKSVASYVAPLTVLQAAVLYKSWRIVPALVRGDFTDGGPPPDPARKKKAREIADAVEWHLRNIVDDGGVIQNPKDVCFEILNAVHCGFSVQEIEWRKVADGPYAGQLGFRRFSPKRAKQIGFALDPINFAVRSLVNSPAVGMPRDMLPSYLPDSLKQGGGLEIPVEKVILYTFHPENGLPYGRGVARACYKPWYILNLLEKAHARAMEKFAGPGIMANAPLGAKGKLDAVRDAIDAYRNGASLVLPENVKAQIIQAATNSFDSFLAAKRWCAEQMAHTILLQQLTTRQGTGTGSYALGEVHQHTQEYQLQSVRTDLEWLWTNQVIRRFVLYNYGPDCLDLVPRFDLGVWDAHEKKLLADFWSKLVGMKAVHPLEPAIREQVGVDPLEPEYRSLLETLIATEIVSDQLTSRVTEEAG